MRVGENGRASARAESCCPFCLPILQPAFPFPFSFLLSPAARGVGNVLLWPTSHGFIILTQYTNCPCWRNCWAATQQRQRQRRDAARLVYSLLAVIVVRKRGDSARRRGRDGRQKEWIEQKASECRQHKQRQRDRERWRERKSPTKCLLKPENINFK